MKKYIFPLVLLFTNLVCYLDSRAQAGWKWGIDGVNGSAEENWVAADKAGNVYAAASNFYGDYTVYGADTVFNPAIATGSYYAQLVIAKADSNGHFLWEIGSMLSNAAPVNMATDTSGNLYVLGVYTDTFFSIGTYTLSDTALGATGMLFLMKVSAGGTVQWVENIAPNRLYAGAGIIYGAQVGVDGAGYVYIAGGFTYPTLVLGSITLMNSDSSGGTSDQFVAKFRPDGSCVWAKKMGYTDNDVTSGLAVTPGGNVYVSGLYYSDTLLAEGTYLYGDTGLAYISNSLLKFDSSGHLTWAKNISPYLEISDVTVDANENFYACGIIDTTALIGTSLIGGAGNSDAFWARYDSSGNPVYGVSGGGSGEEEGWSISVDKYGNVFFCGEFGDQYSPPGYTMHFGSHSLSYPWSYAATDPMFVAEFDNTGNYVRSMAMTSGGDDYCGVAVDNYGGLYVSGDFMTNLVFGPDSLLVTGFETLFISRYKYDTSACDFLPTPAPGYTCTGAPTVDFTYTGTTTYDSLVWNFGDGTTATVTNPVHTYTAGGIYTACVTLYTGCTGERTYTYCNGINIPLGVADITAVDDIKIFPNPATTQLTIAGPGPVRGIDITNLLGQTVYSSQPAGHSRLATIDVSALPTGVYFVKVNDITTGKFIKE